MSSKKALRPQVRILGRRILERRELRNIKSAAQLANKISELGYYGPGPRWIQLLENGSREYGEPDLVEPIAVITLTNPKYFLGESDDPTPVDRTAVALRTLLLEAKSVSTSPAARTLLKRIELLSAPLPSDSPSIEILLLRARALAALAQEEATPHGRTEAWLAALNVLKGASELFFDIRVSWMYASIAVDFFQDPLASATRTLRSKSLLAAEKDFLDPVITELQNRSSKEACAALLARKSAVLRCRTWSFATRELKLKLCAHAHRCASRACGLSRTTETILELGLASWGMARFESGDERRRKLIDEAEQTLKEAAESGNEACLLSLARFYRHLQRPRDACTTFRRLLNSQWLTRRHLQDAYVFGESANNCWYEKKAQSRDVVFEDLQRAKELVSEAIVAGYDNARIVVTLARLTAILDGNKEALIEINRLGVGPRGFNWDIALRLAELYSSDDLTEFDLCSRAFVLGMAQSGVYTAIGTILWDHFNDIDRAEQFYSAALKIDTLDFVAKQNLALIKRTRGELKTAYCLAGEAETCAPRTFLWPRQLKSELANELIGDAKGEQGTMRGDPH